MKTFLDLVRGALIGSVETVPGISGGTVALMTGVYERILLSAGHIISGLRLVVTDGLRGRGLIRARDELRQAHWRMLIPLGVGMVLALLATARLMEQLLHDHPVVMRALFLGLVLASLSVPYRLAANANAHRSRPGRWRGIDYVFAGAAAVAAMVVVSLPRGSLTPSTGVLVFAGAIAVAALALPGLSGSFLLLTMGLYEPTLGALNDRDLGYIGTFVIGCVIGLVTVVKLLQWLLERHRHLTLVILTGVMAGGMLALWPWTDDHGARLAPTEHVLASIMAFVVGILVVVAILVAEHKLADRADALVDSELADDEPGREKPGEPAQSEQP